MSSLFSLEVYANIIQLVTSVAITIWFIISSKEKMGAVRVFFLWGLISLIFENIYWVAMLLVDGVGSYAFTATDASLLGCLLLWSSIFQMRWKILVSKKNVLNHMTIGAIIFGILNLIWWCYWSANYAPNVICAIVTIIFSFVVAYAIYQTKALSKAGQIVFYGAIIILIVFETVFFFADGMLYLICDWICAAAWLMLCLVFYIASFTNKKDRTKLLCGSMMFAIYTVWMTDGLIYNLFMFVEIIIVSTLVITFNSDEFEEVEEK